MTRTWLPLVLTGAVLASVSFAAGRCSVVVDCPALPQRPALQSDDFFNVPRLPETGNKRY